MFVDLSSLASALQATFSPRWRSPRRVGFTVLCVSAMAAFYLLNVVMRSLDEILFPGYHKVEIRPPLIVTANPRSGTTLLHRLISLDEARFTTFRLYHVLFPSVCLFKLGSLFSRQKSSAPDGPALGGPFRRLALWLKNRIFVRWRGMHLVGLNTREEDEGLMFFTFASGSLYIVFPYFNEVPAPRFADSLSPRKRRALAHYYRNCVQRFLYATGPDKTFLMKSVFFVGRMKLMHEVFPDARVVYLIRNPLQTLPSFVSMFTALFWKIHSPEIPEDSDEYRQWAKLGIDYYRYFQQNRYIFGDNNLMIFRYKDLIKSPRDAVIKICRRFGMELTQKHLTLLEQESESQRKFKSSHDYSLDRYGLSREWIERELPQIFESYGF